MPPDSHPPSDPHLDRDLLRDWVVQLQHNDERALTAIANHFANRLGAIATVLTGRRDLAQEVVQDVLLALWDRRHNLDSTGNVLGYLYRSIHNKSIDVLRRERGLHRTVEAAAMDGRHNPIVAENDGEHSLAHSDLSLYLHRALAAVAPGPRRVFLLCHESGLEYPEIADMLGVTIATVRTMMYRATRTLAGILPKDLLLPP